MQLKTALRVMISVKERSFQIESVARVETVLPPSLVERGQEQAERYGTWFAVENAQGYPLYRRLLDNFLVEGTEVFTGEAREFHRVHTPAVRRAISIIVPEIPDGVLAIHASEVNKAGHGTPAKPIFRINMRELAELAAKGGTQHGCE